MTAAPSAATPPTANSKPKRTRRQRWLRFGVIVLVIALLSRFSLGLVLPFAVDRVAAIFGLTCEYQRLDLGLLSGEAHLWGLVIGDRDGSPADGDAPPPYVQLAHAHFDLDVWALFSGKVVVRDLQVDGVVVRIERDPDGQLVLAKHLPLAEPAAEEPVEIEHADEVEPERLARALDFRLPLEVLAARFQHVRLQVVDRSTTPAIDTWVEAHVQATDLGVAGIPARLEVYAHSPRLFDRAAVQATIDAREDQLVVELAVDVRSIHPTGADPWLEPFGIAASGEDLGFELTATAKASRSASVVGALDADFEARDLRFTAEGEPRFSMAKFAARVTDATATGVNLPLIEVAGVHGVAERRPDGIVRIAGLDFRGAAEPAPVSDSVAPEPLAPIELPEFAARLELMRATDISLVFVDRAVAPANELEFAVDSAELRDLSTAAGAAGAAPFRIVARVPRTVETATIDGTITPDGPGASLVAKLAAEQVTFAAFAPYLEEFGAEPTLEHGTARCELAASARLDGTSIHGDFAVRALEFADAEPLFSLETFAVHDWQAALDGGRLRLGEVEVSGGRLPLHRDDNALLHGLGLRSLAPYAFGQFTRSAAVRLANEATAERAPTDPSWTNALPRFELGHLACTDLTVTARDAFLAPAVEFSPLTVSAEAESIVIGGEGSGDPATGRLHLVARLPGIMPQLEASGTLTSRPGPPDLGLHLTVGASSLDTRPLAPYISAAGMEPTISGGDLKLQLDAAVRAEQAGLDGMLHVSDLTFRESAERVPFTLARLLVDDVAFRPGVIRVGVVEVDGAALRLGRDAGGGLLLPSLRLLPGQLDLGQTTQARIDELESPALATGKLELPPVAIDRLEVRGAQLQWTDRAVASEVSSEVTVDATLRQFATTAGASPAPFELTATSPGVVESAVITGSLQGRPGDLRAEASVDVRGMRAGPLAGYLPAAVKSELQDGRVAMGLSAHLVGADSDTAALDVALRDLVYRDGDTEPLFRCAAVELAAPHIVPARGDITMSAAVRGVRMTLTRTGPLAFEFLGLSFDPRYESAADVTARPAPPVAAEDLAVATPPATGADVSRTELTEVDDGSAAAVENAAVARATEASEARRAVEAAAAKATADAQTAGELPAVILSSLELELEQFRFVDAATGEAGEPLDIRGTISTGGPVTLLAADPEQLPPIKLFADGSAEPLLGSFHAELSATPWQPEARLEGSFELSQLHGSPLARVLPELAGAIGGDELRDGSVTGKLGLALQLRRRTPVDIDFGRGFGVEFALEDVAMRAQPDGEILAGVGGVFVEAPRIDADGDVHIASIEVIDIRGRARRDADGIHALGLTVRMPEPVAPDEVDADPPPVAEAEEPGGEAAPQPAVAEVDPAEGPDIRVDHIHVHGLDFQVVDEAVEPAAVIPLTGLDLDVERFSTAGLRRGRPLRFQCVVQAGEIELPRRISSSSALSGVLSSTGDLIAGTGDEVELVKRPLMDEFSLQGRLSLMPRVRGRVWISLNALELGAFRGEAEQMGVSLADGVFDAGIELRLREDSVYTFANFTFGNLDVSEAPGGPVSTYLALPAPLQTVVFVLRDDTGEINVPLSVEVEGTDVSASQITGAVLAAFGSLVTNAVAAAPLRLGGTVTGLLGFAGGEAVGPAAVRLPFNAAAAVLSPVEQAELRGLHELLLDDPELVVELRHSFGRLDGERARRLANPTTAEARALAARLRQRRDVLSRDRGTLAAEAVALYEMGEVDRATAASARLRAVHRELGETEQALDRTLAHLRPGADRRTTRRTRHAALGIAQRRLDVVHDWLLGLDPDLAGRIEVRRPQIDASDGHYYGAVVVTPKVRKVQAAASDVDGASDGG